MKKIILSMLVIMIFSLWINLILANTTKTKIPDPLEWITGTYLLDSTKWVDKITSGTIWDSILYKKIPYILKITFNLWAGIAVLMLVIYGIMFLIHSLIDWDSTIDKAKWGIVYSLWWLLVMILARAIVSIVEYLPLG